jgi:predicted O-linked N-acetylglucosamine transferase (SPINDLY family)
MCEAQEAVAEEPSPAPEADLAGLLARAEALQSAGDEAAVVRVYHDWLTHHGTHALAHVAWFNLGVAHATLKDPVAAATAYRRAIVLQPAFAEAHLNLGSQLEQQGRAADAIATWRGALDAGIVGVQTRPSLLCHLLNNLGRALENARDYEAAEDMLQRSLLSRPDQPDVLQHWVHLRQRQCRWPVHQPFGEVTLAMMVRATSPLAMLAATDDPGLQLYRATVFLQDKVLPGLPAQPRDGTAATGVTSCRERDRLKIGYLSSDFCQHAVALLMVDLIERHDRSRVEVTAFSWSRDDGSTVRDRIRHAVSSYVPVGHLSDDAAAQAIRDRGIDVLIDLQGLTSGARPGILARRPAPVQATWLGFPGTTGMPFIDYVIADRFVLPESQAPYFVEKPLYLPHCFQPSDSRRQIGAAPSRAACGLPSDGVIYCSFNNNYKFDRPVFASWMRILDSVPRAVLWLLADNRWAEANLRREAEAHGIDPARLVFAPRIAPDQYLARYGAADLFLDTRPFSAGTTASDALWAGLPLLTCPGRTFASRMAGSLLRTLGLPELIAADPDDYVARAIALGREPADLDALKVRLARARQVSALFDIGRLARDLEDALAAVAPV